MVHLLCFSFEYLLFICLLYHLNLWVPLLSVQPWLLQPWFSLTTLVPPWAYLSILYVLILSQWLLNLNDLSFPKPLFLFSITRIESCWILGPLRMSSYFEILPPIFRNFICLPFDSTFRFGSIHSATTIAGYHVKFCIRTDAVGSFCRLNDPWQQRVGLIKMQVSPDNLIYICCYLITTVLQ